MWHVYRAQMAFLYNQVNFKWQFYYWQINTCIFSIILWHRKPKTRIYDHLLQMKFLILHGNYQRTILYHNNYQNSGIPVHKAFGRLPPPKTPKEAEDNMTMRISDHLIFPKRGKKKCWKQKKLKATTIQLYLVYISIYISFLVFLWVLQLASIFCLWIHLRRSNMLSSLI